MESKGNSFSIYLLQSKQWPDKAVKKEKHEVHPIKGPSRLPKGSVLYLCTPEKADLPWWVEYSGVNADEFERTSNNSLLAFIPTGKRFFVLAFGQARHYLKLECCVPDFGLLVALRSIDRERLQSFGANNLGSSLKLTAQANNFSALEAFVKQERNLWRSIAGAVRKENLDFFDWVSSSNISLRCISHLEPDKLADLLKRLLKLYRTKEKDPSFPEFHYIERLSNSRDRNLIQELDASLLLAINEKESGKLEFSLPAVTNTETMRIVFDGSKEEYFSVDLNDFYRQAENKPRARKKISMNYLKDGRLKIIDEGEQDGPTTFSLYKCFVFSTEVEEEVYYLSLGKWYRVGRDFLAETKKLVAEHCNNQAVTLLDYNHCNEGCYNSDKGHKKAGMICLDKTKLLPKEKSSPEPCDLYLEESDKTPVFVHVKNPRSSQDYSHLFNQAIVPLQLIRTNKEALANLNELIKGRDKKLGAVKSSREVKVVLAIITDKDITDDSSIIPLFSQISIRSILKELKLMAADVCFQYVKNACTKEKHKKKTRKKEKPLPKRPETK